MKNILIICDYSDVHGFAVEWGLRKAGQNAQVVDLSDPQSLNDFTVIIKNEARPVITYQGNVIDICWARRMRPLNFSKLSMAPHLAKHIAGELHSFRDNLLYGMANSKNTCFINSYNALLNAEQKCVQLMAADRIGLKIPYTLISNQSHRVEELLDAPYCVVVKPFSPHHWRMKERQVRRVAVANRLTTQKFKSLDKATIEACPAIYQEEIKKTHDIRAAVIGNEVFCSICEASDEMLDSRFLEGVSKKPYNLPPNIQQKLIALLSGFGLDICSADLVIDSRGDHYFIELNPSGAMLMLEEQCALPVLERLVSHFCGQSVNCNISFDQFRKSEEYATISQKYAEFMNSQYVAGASNHVSIC